MFTALSCMLLSSNKWMQWWTWFLLDIDPLHGCAIRTRSTSWSPGSVMIEICSLGCSVAANSQPASLVYTDLQFPNPYKEDQRAVCLQCHTGRGGPVKSTLRGMVCAYHWYLTCQLISWCMAPTTLPSPPISAARIALSQPTGLQMTPSLSWVTLLADIPANMLTVQLIMKWSWTHTASTRALHAAYQGMQNYSLQLCKQGHWATTCGALVWAWSLHESGKACAEGTYKDDAQCSSRC